MPIHGSSGRKWAMGKNKVRIWELLGLAAVLIAAKIFSRKKPKALPGPVIDVKESREESA